jgi:hypothetical protein
VDLCVRRRERLHLATWMEQDAPISNEPEMKREQTSTGEACMRVNTSIGLLARRPVVVAGEGDGVMNGLQYISHIMRRDGSDVEMDARRRSGGPTVSPSHVSTDHASFALEGN